MRPPEKQPPGSLTDAMQAHRRAREARRARAGRTFFDRRGQQYVMGDTGALRLVSDAPRGKAAVKRDKRDRRRKRLALARRMDRIRAATA